MTKRRIHQKGSNLAFEQHSDSQKENNQNILNTAKQQMQDMRTTAHFIKQDQDIKYQKTIIDLQHQVSSLLEAQNDHQQAAFDKDL